mmetsp:Transcript_38942/g.76583  ORF Transcript_38942/g.76583 Transcript_38942/m.76583 type:complete len:217 (-) Transcript_38942:174-824(-)
MAAWMMSRSAKSVSTMAGRGRTSGSWFCAVERRRLTTVLKASSFRFLGHWNSRRSAPSAVSKMTNRRYFFSASFSAFSISFHLEARSFFHCFTCCLCCFVVGSSTKLGVPDERRLVDVGLLLAAASVCCEGAVLAVSVVVVVVVGSEELEAGGGIDNCDGVLVENGGKTGEAGEKHVSAVLLAPARWEEEPPPSAMVSGALAGGLALRGESISSGC